MRLMLFATFLLAANVSAATFECKYTAERPLDIDPAGVHALVLKLESSDAHVRGVAGLNKIEVRGKACASQEDWLADLTVAQGREGDRVVVTTNQHRNNTISVFHSNYAYIDLEVRIPVNLPLQIQSNSGDADIADIASLDFATHSGDLLADHISGAVSAELGSGDIKADDIGSLELRRSGSGDVRARKVHGDVRIGNVGSGDLAFEDVSKSVRVNSVGSGDVGVHGAGGDVVIDSIGSGDVTASDVGGDFIVKASGSGDIHHHGVKGKVSVPERDDD
jgi:DUF4097 and DUF4098 domain-containing protein YvlB